MNKPHYAWMIVFAGSLITGAGAGIFNSCFGVFIKPVCEDLGFLRGRFTMCGSISMFVSMLLMPLFGAIFRRFGFKRIAVIGMIVCSLSFAGYSMASELWQFYVLALVCGLFINCVGIMSVGILVSNWFFDKRGLAAGIAYSGSGFLAAILIPVANKFIQSVGWRWTYRFLGSVAFLVLATAILFIVKDKPEDIGLKPYVSKNRAGSQKAFDPYSGLTRKEAFHTRSFRLLALAVMGIALCQAGPHTHTISFLSDLGYSASYASTVASTYLIFLTGFKIVMGLLFDRIGSLVGSLLIGGCCVLFPVFALLAAFPVSPWIYALLLGLASSGTTILGTVLTANYFGRKDFSLIYSVISMFSYIGVAVSSPVLGSIYDSTGSYTLACVLIMGMGVAVCACLIGAYRSRVLRAEGSV
jgi:MFS family permease